MAGVRSFGSVFRFVYAARLRRSSLRILHYRHVLVIGGETLSKVIDWQDRNTCVLFETARVRLCSALLRRAMESAPLISAAMVQAAIYPHVLSSGSPCPVHSEHPLNSGWYSRPTWTAKRSSLCNQGHGADSGDLPRTSWNGSGRS